MNKNLTCKNYATRDEFYTTKETAELSIANLKDGELKAKKMYLNCDGPESELYKLMKRRYHELGLAHLTATKFIPDGRGIRMDFDGIQETQTSLEGDGDFRSEECVKILDENDVIFTNPPFTLDIEWIPLVIAHKKDFIVFCNLLNLFSKKRLRPILESGVMNDCSRFLNGSYFRHKDGNICRMPTRVMTTLHTISYSRRMPSKTFAHLEAKGKIRHTDQGELEVQLLQNLPVDYYGEILCPVTIFVNEHIRKDYEILGLSRKTSVAGKSTFARARVKRRQ